MRVCVCVGGGLVPVCSAKQAGLQTLHGLIRAHIVPPASPLEDVLPDAHMAWVRGQNNKVHSERNKGRHQYI